MKKDFVIDETGYVPKAIVEKMKKKKKEREQRKGKIVKGR